MVSDRLARFGSSVFTEISVLARRHGAIDLGQGFPGWEGPAFVKAEAARALDAGDGATESPEDVGRLIDAVINALNQDAGGGS